jgi:phosphopantothenoylcysteine decarboxylase/phosphopantothenate--cysteine ligase
MPGGQQLPKPSAGRPERPVLPQKNAEAPLTGRHIVLGVTGSIAAYKAAMLLRLLQKAGATVDVIVSETAKRFIGEATFRGLGAEVHTDMWSSPGELHVSLGERADAILIAPATADVLARLSQGRGDDLLTATVLCRSGALILAPAMHPRMWHNAAVEENVAVLTRRGAKLIGPVSGEVASGDVGFGRMAEPEQIALELAQMLSGAPRDAQAALGSRPSNNANAQPSPAKNGDSLVGRHIVVSAGPTVEPIDPVRSLSNVSSGKMGFAIAAEARARGARVTLIAGPVALPTPSGVERVDVGSALEMRDALWGTLGESLTGADALVMAAAVADYRPKTRAESKLKRSANDLSIELVPNPDLLAEIGGRRTGRNPVLVGFALETAENDELIQHARKKLVQKRVDLVVANRAEDSLGRDDNKALFVSPRDCQKLNRSSKAELASHIVDWISEKLTEIPEENTL